MADKIINLVVADMGYGHQRAAYPLLSLSGGEIFNVNKYQGIPDWEKKYWQDNLEAYEKISRFKKVPLLGQAVFSVMDYFQRIKPRYPFRNLSRRTWQQEYFFKLIQRGLGKDLMAKLSRNNKPLVTTFFVAAYMAEYHNYNGDIYCIVCDADISRAWAPLDPPASRIKYFAPNKQVETRLMMYGVRPENIIVTGFPLPQENVGAKQEILKRDLARRLISLDITGEYRKKEGALLRRFVPECLHKKSSQPINITFAVGGAGAQKEIGVLILKKLAPGIRSGKFSLNLVAGVRPEVVDYFQEAIDGVGLGNHEAVKIIFHKDKNGYFRLFNKVLRATDILWTKPSELSFYSGLGLPVLMSSPVGSQEDFNREWLMSIGAGIDSFNPEYVNEWLPDMLESGRLARAAMDGFLNAESLGVYNIEKFLKKKI